MNSLIVGVAIGLVFSFAVLAAVTSVVTEGIARYLGLRGEYLLRGLRSMLDGDGDFSIVNWPPRFTQKPRTAKPVDVAPATVESTKPWVTKVMEHPLISPSGSQGQVVENAGDTADPLTNKERRKLPSYVSARSFAEALIDLTVPDAAGNTTFNEIRTAIEANVHSPVLQKSLLSLLKGTQGGIDAFRVEIERWYDDQMARVSGWYKRHVRWISLAIGLALVLGFNVNAIAIGRALYGDESLREAVVTQAAQASDCSATEGAASCLQKIQKQITGARVLGLPLGWTPVASCPADTVTGAGTVTTKKCSFAERYGLTNPDQDGLADVVFFLTVLAGYVLMVLSLVPGARFWFDLLGKLGSLRSSGPKPRPAS